MFGHHKSRNISMSASLLWGLIVTSTPYGCLNAPACRLQRASRSGQSGARACSELQALEILPEGFIDDLGVGEAVEIGLSPDRLNPTLFDVEGDTLGLAAGITGVFQGRLAGLPPGSKFLKDGEQTDKHILVNR